MKIHRLLQTVAGIAVFAFAQATSATTITYNFWLDAPNGYSITDLVLYAAGAGVDDVFLSPVELSPSGSFQLSQSVGFEPTSALIVGMTERDKDDWWDVVMFTSDAYAQSAIGQRYDALFLNDTPGNLGHNVLTPTLQDAHDGVPGALGLLTDFLRSSGAAAAYFDPRGSYSIIQFSFVEPPIGGDVPAPATIALFGIGLAGLGWSRRKKV